MSLYLKRAILIFIVMLMIVVYLTVTLYQRDFRSAFSGDTAKNIVIDPGHGEPDGGAVGYNGTEEQEINLIIAQKLNAKLDKMCYNTRMTRDTEEGIYSEGSTIKEKKVSDMHNRESIMNDENTGIFVSVHLNIYSDKSSHGAQVFYSVNDDDSKALGESIQAELLRADPTNSRVAKSAGSSIYLMKKAKVPAVIVECGFISNPHEECILCTNDYQVRIATAIARGIDLYYKEKNEESD
ncbi:MAG: N-acetylmuramoyl-L-alanine amidase [Bacillota bacterium]|nr:N-acetylmuramoyl-L-alanine amidase [Bacillota bacterium]